MSSRRAGLFAIDYLADLLGRQGVSYTRVSFEETRSIRDLFDRSVTYGAFLQGVASNEAAIPPKAGEQPR